VISKNDHGLTLERLKEVLDYCPEDGVFRWRIRRGGSATAGSVAGSIVAGYRRIGIDKKGGHSAGRLAWFYVHGHWPPNDIDHVNNDRDDNRLSNLRLATRAQNIANVPVRSDNVAKLRGVTKGPWGYVARVTIKGDRRYLGIFKTPQDAHATYVKAAREFYGEYHRV